MWENKSPPAMAGAKLVVSLKGDILSPKYAPDSTAPAVIPNEMPKASPIPIKAIPTVAAVVQLLPVAMEIMAQITTLAAKKYGRIQYLKAIIDHCRNNSADQPSAGQSTYH